jgi:hypothetical protein
MKLYVCFGTFGPNGHPCNIAYTALRQAGYDPEIEKVRGIGWLPKVFRDTAGRKKVTELTGNHHVPTLVTDDNKVVDGSKTIEEWAKQHPLK